MSNTFKKFMLGWGLVLMFLTSCSSFTDQGPEKNSPEVNLTTYQNENSDLSCVYDITAPKEAIYLQINVKQYTSGEA